MSSTLERERINEYVGSVLGDLPRDLVGFVGDWVKHKRVRRSKSPQNAAHAKRRAATFGHEDAPLKRDLDYIRELLLEIEAGKTAGKTVETLSSEAAAILGASPEKPMSQEEADKLSGHLDLMQREGLIEIESSSLGGAVVVGGLTWKGHDLLDSIRDPEIWRKTKDGAAAAKGWTIDLLRDLAKGFIKKQIEEHTGVKL